MPKFKSKKKKSRKNKKQDDKKNTLTEDNSLETNENTSTVVVPVTVVDVVIDESKISEEKNVQEGDVFEETNLHQDISAIETSETNVTVGSVKLDDSSVAAVTSTPASSKKKRFSFLKKKNRSLSALHVDSPDSSMDSSKNDTTIQRANSIGHVDSKEHKSKIPRFRSSKKKNNLSASCSNFESTSLVLNPGMDDWRMTGLLHTVDKTNSTHSLNTTKSSEKEEPSATLHPSFTEKREEKSPSKITEEIELQPTREETEGEIADETPEIKVEVETVAVVVAEEAKPPEDFVEANIDFEYSAEIHDKPKPVEIDLKMNSNDERDGEATGSDVGFPTLKDASTDAELYELENDERVVSIRKLEDIVRESKISLPKEVAMNDWLVLNVINREIPSF